jgi:hypothetical protein
MNQCPPGPQVFHGSHFEFFQKFAEIFANYCLSPVSTTPVINCSAVSTTPAKNLLPVSLTPVINLCHGFSVIAGVVDTGEQFITGDNDTGNNFVAGDNDTGEQLSPGDNDTGDKFIAGHKNKDAIEVGSCQGKEKGEGDKSAISPAAEVGHGRRWYHWNRHEKLHPKTPLDQRPLRPPKLNNAVLV